MAKRRRTDDAPATPGSQTPANEPQTPSREEIAGGKTVETCTVKLDGVRPMTFPCPRAIQREVAIAAFNSHKGVIGSAHAHQVEFGHRMKDDNTVETLSPTATKILGANINQEE